MLQAIAALPVDRQRGVLARASEELQAPRFVEGPSVDLGSEDSSLVRELLEEVRRSAEQFHPRDDEQRRLQMLDLVSSAISMNLLPSPTKEIVRSKLGDDGRLPLSSYQISFTPKFEARAKFWGVSHAHVLNAIYKNDQTQHFTTKLEGPNGPASASLFTQVPPAKGPAFTVLVHAFRNGFQLGVDSAFKIYHDEVAVSELTEPLEVLRAFVEKFGVEIKISSEKNVFPPETAKFYHDKIIDLLPGDALILQWPNQVVRFDSKDLSATGKGELSLTYTISDANYIASLARHGVKVQPTTGSAQSINMRHT